MALEPENLSGLSRFLRRRSSLGQLAVMKGLLSPAQLQECLRDQKATGRRLESLLLERGVIPADDLAALLEEHAALEVDEEVRIPSPPAGTTERIEGLLGAEATAPSERAAGRATLRPGHRVGRYELLEILGEGGMGVVFRARDESLGREVALKMLKVSSLFSPAQIERFRREERNAARLRHPGIAAIYEIGGEGDLLYYTMELVSGRPFNRIEGDLRRRVAILEKVARAVQYAHEQGVIHRDLKPANILVDGRDEPRLLDFGLSRDLGAPSDLSRTGGILGTPYYMSPEQADGRVHDADARTDVYALGTILYEAMAGRVPFSGESMGEVVRRVRTEESAPPPGPADLVTVCQRAMEKEAERRYPSAGAFADELARFLAGEPVLARPVGPLSRLVRKARRNPLVFSLGAAAAAALLAAGLAAFAHSRKALRLEAERQERLKALQDMARLSLDVALRLRRAGANEGMRQMLPELESAYGQALEVAPGVAEVEYYMGRMYRALMDDDQALAYQTRALEKDPRFAPALYERAILLSKRYAGEVRRATEALRAASLEASSNPPRVDRSAVERRRPDLAELRKTLVRLCAELEHALRAPPSGAAAVKMTEANVEAVRGLLALHEGRVEEAARVLEEVVRKDALLEEAWEALAHAAERQWEEPLEKRWAKAEDRYSQGLTHDRGYVPFLVGRGETRMNRGDYGRGVGGDPLPDYLAAETDFTSAIELDPRSYEAALGRGWVRNRRGACRIERGEDPRGDLEGAEEDLVRACELDPQAAEPWARLGNLRGMRGLYRARRGEDPLADYASAEHALTQALALDPRSAETWTWRGGVRYLRGMNRKSRGEDPQADYVQAEEDVSRALQLKQDSAWIWTRRGTIRAFQGLHLQDRNGDPRPFLEAAEEDLNQALRIQGEFAAALGQRGHVLRYKARYWELKGEAGRALADYRRAAVDYADALRINPSLSGDLEPRLRAVREKCEALKDP